LESALGELTRHEIRAVGIRKPQPSTPTGGPRGFSDFERGALSPENRALTSAVELSIRRTLSAQQKETTMRLIRACLVVLAILVPVSWTVAHAEDTGAAGSTGKGKKKSGKKKGTGGESGEGGEK
jgi:hypothetical protein